MSVADHCDPIWIFAIFSVTGKLRLSARNTAGVPICGDAAENDAENAAAALPWLLLSSAASRGATATRAVGNH